MSFDSPFDHYPFDWPLSPEDYLYGFSHDSPTPTLAAYEVTPGVSPVNSFTRLPSDDELTSAFLDEISIGPIPTPFLSVQHHFGNALNTELSSVDTQLPTTINPAALWGNKNPIESILQGDPLLHNYDLPVCEPEVPHFLIYDPHEHRMQSPCPSLTSTDSFCLSPSLLNTPSTSYPPSPSPFNDDSADERSEDNADDGEYSPSPSQRNTTRAPSKREGKLPARPSPYTAPMPASSSRLTPCMDALALSPPGTPASAGKRITAQRRNRQVDTLSVPSSPLARFTPSPSPAADAHRGGMPKLECPHCGYAPGANREPDLRRHMKTHRAREHEDEYVCCGVPLRLAAEYGIADITGLPVQLYAGEQMVGGCMKTYSRKDAYSRHLRAAEAAARERGPGRGDAPSCGGVGDANGLWLLGNVRARQVAEERRAARAMARKA